MMKINITYADISLLATAIEDNLTIHGFNDTQSITDEGIYRLIELASIFNDRCYPGASQYFSKEDKKERIEKLFESYQITQSAKIDKIIANQKSK